MGMGLSESKLQALASELFFAVKRDDAEVVGEICGRVRRNKGVVIPDFRDDAGNTTLHVAAWRGNESICASLLSAGLDVHALSPRRETPLHFAAYRGRVEVIRLLMEAKSPTGDVNADGDTCLHLAVLSANIAAVRAVVMQDPTLLRYANDEGCLPLHYACGMGFNAIVELLVQCDMKGDTLARPTKNMETPLMLAVTSKKTDIVEHMCSKCPSAINARDQKGFTALHIAVLQQVNPIIKLLIERGADKSIANENGSTALNLAEGLGRPDVLSVIRRTEPAAGVIGVAPPTEKPPRVQNTRARLRAAATSIAVARTLRGLSSLAEGATEDDDSKSMTSRSAHTARSGASSSASYREPELVGSSRSDTASAATVQMSAARRAEAMGEVVMPSPEIPHLVPEDSGSGSGEEASKLSKSSLGPTLPVVILPPPSGSPVVGRKRYSVSAGIPVVAT